MTESKEKISERLAIIRSNTNTPFLSLREEFIDMNLEEGDTALITLWKNPEGDTLLTIKTAFKLPRDVKKVEAPETITVATTE